MARQTPPHPFLHSPRNAKCRKSDDDKLELLAHLPSSKCTRLLLPGISQYEAPPYMGASCCAYGSHE
ncbi:hypothetical protein G6O67_008524 [Ophiocordyceps sinensis]|uniref:Uncharacterized protein n=1 Tax=Ophiocordyceps sinensis TaxID=72228 RepID=A0A8H4LT15_9HYPO|nr:hypothetical protein G6O67_008524 [Ophiocordyceps sinensis]